MSMAPETIFTLLCFLKEEKLNDLNKKLFENSNKALLENQDKIDGFFVWIKAVKSDIYYISKTVIKNRIKSIPLRVLYHTDTIKKNLIDNHAIIKSSGYSFLEVHDKIKKKWKFKSDVDSDIIINKILLNIEMIVTKIEILIDTHFILNTRFSSSFQYLIMYEDEKSPRLWVNSLNEILSYDSNIEDENEIMYLLKIKGQYDKIPNTTFGKWTFPKKKTEIERDMDILYNKIEIKLK